MWINETKHVNTRISGNHLHMQRQQPQGQPSGGVA